jgi:hypothetical protein
VRASYVQVREELPEGLAPVIEVYLLGRPEPIRLTEVQTSRTPEFPWALFVPEPADAEKPSQGDTLIFAPEHHVERVEIRVEMRSVEHRIGFALREFDQPPASSESEPSP